MLMRPLILGGGGTMIGLLLLDVCVRACHAWCPLVMNLHRYYIAVARIAVNHDPGCCTAPDLNVWSVGTRLRSLGCKKLSLLLLRGLIVWVGGDGLWLLFLPSSVLILTAGLTPLVWSWRVSLLCKCSFFMNFGLVREACS